MRRDFTFGRFLNFVAGNFLVLKVRTSHLECVIPYSQYAIKIDELFIAAPKRGKYGPSVRYLSPEYTHQH